MTLLRRLHWARIYAALVTLLLPAAFYEGRAVERAQTPTIIQSPLWIESGSTWRTEIPPPVAAALGRSARVCTARVEAQDGGGELVLSVMPADVRPTDDDGYDDAVAPR